MFNLAQKSVLLKYIDVNKRDVGVATKFRTGRSGVRFPVFVRDFPILQKVQTRREAKPASYSIGSRAPFWGLSGPSVKLLTPSIAEVEN